MQIRKKVPGNQLKIPDCKYVIIDTDAGGDDSQAIVLAISEAKRRGKTILGITCVDGNAWLDDVAVNAQICVSICNENIPIYKGSHTSLIGTSQKDFYFSKDGLGLQQAHYVQKLKKEGRWDTTLLKSKNAMDFIVESIKEHPGEVAIIAIGPLTNLALAYHMDNTIAQKSGFISLMGGSVSALGMRQYFCADFNSFLDAQASQIVMKVFPRIIINSMDLTLDLDKYKSLKLFTEQTRQKAKFINDIYSQILKTHKPIICDPLACIPVFSPEDIVDFYEAYAEVEIVGLRTRGLLVFDWLQTQELPNRLKIMAIQSIDLDSLIQRISDSYN